MREIPTSWFPEFAGIHKDHGEEDDDHEFMRRLRSLPLRDRAAIAARISAAFKRKGEGD